MSGKGTSLSEKAPRTRRKVFCQDHPCSLTISTAAGSDSRRAQSLPCSKCNAMQHEIEKTAPCSRRSEVVPLNHPSQATHHGMLRSEPNSQPEAAEPSLPRPRSSLFCTQGKPNEAIVKLSSVTITK